MKIKVVVHPKSKKPRVETGLFGELSVYVKEPPVEGKANSAAARALAEHFKVSKSRVELLSGSRGKHKLFEIK